MRRFYLFALVSGLYLGAPGALFAEEPVAEPEKQEQVTAETQPAEVASSEEAADSAGT